MQWILGWPLLILSLYLHEPYREQVLAAQTIVCTIIEEKRPFKIITMIYVALYFTQLSEKHHPINIIILHHVIILCISIIQYTNPNYKVLCWTLIIWTSRWLGSVNIYAQPIRTTIKSIVLAGLIQGNWGVRNEERDGLKWSWILFVHEIAWCVLPIQILYEVYYKNKQENRMISIV
jgi:hypothetical protein